MISNFSGYTTKTESSNNYSGDTKNRKDILISSVDLEFNAQPNLKK